MSKKNQKKPQDKMSDHYIGKIVDTIAYPLYMIDLDYNIKLTNAAARKAGIKAEKHCYEATHNIDKPCSGDHICPLRKVMKTKKAVNVEHIHYSKSGKRSFVDIYAAPMLNAKGEVVSVLESSIDITERKEAELAVNTIFKSVSESTGQDFF